ncbi:MAG: hypothetical protein HGA22_05735 [Clostridiales bacterium]|nr:hypothetical protein [Clostridiales bacterium]
MMNSKENFIEILKGGMPRYFPKGSEHRMVLTPGEHNDGGEMINGVTIGLDWFGCSWSEFGQGIIDGATITPHTKRLSDITAWKEAMPTVDFVKSFDWEGYSEKILEGFDRENQVLECRSLIGLFERMHCLVGFEDALCAFYEEPEAVEEYLQAMVEYKKAVIECVAEYIKPDIMIFDDDYGTSNNTFLSPELWKKFFPPYWKQIIDFVHEKGMYFELHSCGYITPLVGEFVALGMDILQPMQTHNDYTLLKEKFGDKIVFRQAIFDKQLSAINQTEEEIRSEMQGWFRVLAAGGRFLPDLVPLDDPYYKILGEELEKFEKGFFKQTS